MIERLAAMPARIRAIVEGLSEDKLSLKPAPDVFSLRENVVHLRDVDLEAFEKRVVHTLAETHPFLASFDGALFAQGRDYNKQPVQPALEALAASRARSIARLRNADLDRTAEFEGVGTITLRRLLEMWSQHDDEHIAEMEALLR